MEGLVPDAPARLLAGAYRYWPVDSAGAAGSSAARGSSGGGAIELRSVRVIAQGVLLFVGWEGHRYTAGVTHELAP